MVDKDNMKLTKKRVRPISEEDPLTLFHAANRSHRTDKEYTTALRWLLCDVMEDVLHGTFEERAKEFVEIGRNEPDEMMGMLLGLSEIMCDRTKKDSKDPDYLNPSCVPSYFNSIKKLLNMNNVPVNWKYLNSTFPERDNVNETQGWTREDIRLMLDHAKCARDRALLLVLASSGVRCEGSLLRWGDLMPIYDVGGRMLEAEDLAGRVYGQPACVAVMVYRGTASKYATFITPEAYRAVMDYAAEWEADVGRKPGDGDPIFKNKKELLKGLGREGIRHIIKRMALSAGVRVRHPDHRLLMTIPLFNGFRRFFNKTLKDTVSREMPSSVLIKVERMIGHKGVMQLDSNYYKTDLLELASIYVNAVPNLTIAGPERSGQAGRPAGAATPGLNKQKDGRFPNMDDMSHLERLELLEGMLAYRRRRLAGTASPE